MHPVKCWHCSKNFDLLKADWCACGISSQRPSKVCPHCLQCICLHPDYENDDLWGDVPNFLKKHGFGRLFYLYL